MSLPRLLVTIVAALALIWILIVLAFSSLLANPTSDSGDGRSPARTLTGPEP